MQFGVAVHNPAAKDRHLDGIENVKSSRVIKCDWTTTKIGLTNRSTMCKLQIGFTHCRPVLILDFCSKVYVVVRVNAERGRDGRVQIRRGGDAVRKSDLGQ